MTREQWAERCQNTLQTLSDLMDSTCMEEAVHNATLSVQLLDQWSKDFLEFKLTAEAPPSSSAQTQAEAKAPALPLKPVQETVGWQQLWRLAARVYAQNDLLRQLGVR